MEATPGRLIGLEYGVADLAPVRRRLSTINTRQYQADPEVEWTATRCNRLLRALTSRVAVLRKELTRFQPATTLGNKVLSDKAVASRKWSTLGVGDTEWNQARKRVKRTYSGRGGGRNGHRTASGPSRAIPAVGEVKLLVPGEVSVPTPVLNRARTDAIPRQTSPIPVPYLETRDPGRMRKRPKTKYEEGQFELSEMMRVLRRKIPAARYTTYEGIYNGMETLFKATASSPPNIQQKGPRSLNTMCLIAMPQYIAQEEAILYNRLEETGGRSAINNRDVSTEIYDDLENIGCSGRGYKQLRIIVRSHGVQVISEAIHAGLLDLDFCDILITLCNQMGAGEEGERLLSSLLSARIFPSPRSVFTRFEDDENTRPLLMLWNYAEQKNRFSFQYRNLSRVISNGLLPITWVSTKEFGQVWTRVIQTLSLNTAEPDAMLFMETTILMLAQMIIADQQNTRSRLRGDDALTNATKQTFSSLLTTLTSIVILSQGSESLVGSQEQEPTTPKHERIFVLLRSSLVHWKLFPEINSQGVLLVLSNILLENYASPVSLKNSGYLLAYLGFTENTQYSTCRDNLAAFLCSVARCCGRGTSSLGFQSLKGLHSLLETIAARRETQEVDLLRGIIVDSAYTFAQQVSDPTHLEYAARMEVRFPLVKGSVARNYTPAKVVGTARAGFRWEEGIDEWVPAYSLLKSPEGDGPFRPPVRRSLHESGDYCPTQSHTLPSPSALMDTDGYDGSTGSSPAYSSSDTDEVCNEDESILNRLSQRRCFSAPNFHGDSEDELANNQENQNWSVSSRKSDYNDEVDRSVADNDNGIFSNETLASGGSSSLLCSSDTSISRRPYVDRAPRLRRRVLRHSLQWQLFDEESDDELSFQSTPSLQGEEIMRDITNISGFNLQRGDTKNKGHQRSFQNLATSLLGESEDELCI